MTIYFQKVLCALYIVRAYPLSVLFQVDVQALTGAVSLGDLPKGRRDEDVAESALARLQVLLKFVQVAIRASLGSTILGCTNLAVPVYLRLSYIQVYISLY